MMSEPIKFVVRLSPTIHEKLKKEATKTNSSMNKIVTEILSERYRGKSPTQAKLDKILRLLAEE